MKILITGAAGFIGARLARLLVGEGRSVRALVRDAAKAREALGPGVELALGTMTDPEALRRAADGASAVFHLAALKSDERDIFEVNVGGARNLARACKEAGISRLINVSSQAARMARRGAYGESKARADALLMAAGLQATTLRPSLVYGPGDPGVFGKLANFTAKFPLVPVIGDGKAEFRPIHVDDFCGIAARVLEKPSTAGRSYDVGGPDAVTLEDLIDLIAEKKGVRRGKLHLPAWAALAGAKALSWFFYRPPLSVSNVLGAVQSAPAGDFDAILRETGFKPRPLAEGLAQVLA